MGVAIVDNFFEGHPAFEKGFEFSDFSLQAVALSLLVLKTLGVNPEAELVLSYVDTGMMSDLHAEWMGISGPTDVMSLPMDEIKPGDKRLGILGDLVICPPVAKAQAALQGHTLSDELFLLQTHGILHLLGFDHQKRNEKRRMFKLQEKILEGFLGRRSPVATENTLGIDELLSARKKKYFKVRSL